jgi:hypothetical protein
MAKEEHLDMKTLSVVAFAGTFAVMSVSAVKSSENILIAQSTSPCVDSTDANMRIYLDGYRYMVSKTDSFSVRARANLSLPYLSASQVMAVADTVACRAASIAYDAEMGMAQPDLPVMVLKLETKRLVVKFDETSDGPAPNILFNADFTQVIERILY